MYFKSSWSCDFFFIQIVKDQREKCCIPGFKNEKKTTNKTLKILETRYKKDSSNTNMLRGLQQIDTLFTILVFRELNCKYSSF